MNLLLAYDGSRCAEAAIDDLSQAGLPGNGKAHVISIAEVWLPPPDAIEEPAENVSAYVEEIVRAHRQKGERIVAEASIQVKHAEGRVRTALPGWTVTATATYGSPAWEILAASEEKKSDLIVVGSQGHTALGRFFLGSISQRVLTEAHCSVRVSRGKNEIERGAQRIIVGFDGSKGSTAAVDEVARRSWRHGTEVRLVAATEILTSNVIARFVPPLVRVADDVTLAEEHSLERVAKTSIEKLGKSGVQAGLHIHSGNPKDILVAEAERWGADAVFVGANAYGRSFQQVLLGSTSAAVAARAHCSVEVVRVRTVGGDRSNGSRTK
jgi:nucleotide-binding universal stress UspA family protein